MLEQMQKHRPATLAATGARIEQLGLAIGDDFSWFEPLDTTAPCVMIERQSGVYLGEDDVVRFEDADGRATEVA